VLLHEEIQRNATPFDDAGLPEGEYEFPFSFTYACMRLPIGGDILFPFSFTHAYMWLPIGG
jgi:hypothetical protein